MMPIQPLRHIYNDPSLDRELLLRKLASLRLKSMISIEEYEYLRHLIRKENEDALIKQSMLDKNVKRY